MPSSPYLLALDPSLTAYGWAAIQLGPRDPVLIAAGIIETKPTPKRKRKSVADDDARRVLFITRELQRVIERFPPVIFVVEAAAGSQNAKAAKCLAMSQTLTTCLIDAHLEGGRPVRVSALEAGDAVGIARTQRITRPKGEPAPPVPKGESDRRRKKRKAAIALAVVGRFGAAAWLNALGLPADHAEPVTHHRWEGAHDASAVGLAAWDRPEIAAIRQMLAA